jgi:cysteine desulfuration protein SufE
MKSIKMVEEEIINEFDQFSDIDAKYAHLFKLGDELAVMASELKNEKTLVDGCQSKLWFHLGEDGDGLRLLVDSDSMVIKGIGALFVRLVQGRQAEELTNLSLDFLNQLGIWKLPSERNNGLLAMLSTLKLQAELLSKDN